MKSLFFAVSLVLAAAILIYLFNAVSLEEVINLVQGADRNAVLAFLLVSLATSYLRSIRYQLLLASNGYKVRSIPLFFVVLVRNTFSDFLPARIGTLTYIFLVTTRLGLPLGPAGSSFALAFIFDVLGILPLILVSVLLAGLGQSLYSPAVLLAGCVLLAAGAIAALKLLPIFVEQFGRFLDRFSLLPEALRLKAGKILHEVSSAVTQTKESGIYGNVFFLSILIRFGKYLALYLFLLALLKPLGYAAASLSPPKIFLGLCASELAASLPFSGIMGFGAYQGAWVAAFSLLGFPLELAQVTSLSHHAFTQLYGYSIGLLALGLLALPALKRRTGPSQDVQFTTILPTTESFALHISLVLSALALGVTALLS